MYNPNDCPCLPTWKLPDGTCAAWCDECQSWHVHGAAERPEGHRGAHCPTLWVPPGKRKLVPHHSLYKETGYVLNDQGDATLAIERDMRRRTPRGPYRL